MVLMSSQVLFGQPAPASAVFEVASVKRNTTNGSIDVVPRRSGDLVMMHNTQVYSMIFYAYHLTASYQMVNYPNLPEGWRWYDVDARIGRDANEDEVRLMFQSLLEDRFRLKVHRETRDMPEFELAIAKGKPKLTPASDEPMKLTIEGKSWNQTPGRCGTSGWSEGLRIVCHAVSMDQIVAEVSGALRAPVANRTGLTGTYDLNIRYVPDDAKPDAYPEPGPSLALALQEELRLKLEKGKGPVEVIVIDHIEKPSEN